CTRYNASSRCNHRRLHHLKTATQGCFLFHQCWLARVGDATHHANFVCTRYNASSRCNHRRLHQNCQ
ncbi:MAG: hypothetical protein IJX26_03495, partial [Clostridia bacterium]|nr:hypothetical protein [Clostridia bacterium]